MSVNLCNNFLRYYEAYLTAPINNGLIDNIIAFEKCCMNGAQSLRQNSILNVDMQFKKKKVDEIMSTTQAKIKIEKNYSAEKKLGELNKFLKNIDLPIHFIDKFQGLLISRLMNQLIGEERMIGIDDNIQLYSLFKIIMNNDFVSITKLKEFLSSCKKFSGRSIKNCEDEELVNLVNCVKTLFCAPMYIKDQIEVIAYLYTINKIIKITLLKFIDFKWKFHISTHHSNIIKYIEKSMDEGLDPILVSESIELMCKKGIKQDILTINNHILSFDKLYELNPALWLLMNSLDHLCITSLINKLNQIKQNHPVSLLMNSKLTVMIAEMIDVSQINKALNAMNCTRQNASENQIDKNPKENQLSKNDTNDVGDAEQAVEQNKKVGDASSLQESSSQSEDQDQIKIKYQEAEDGTLMVLPEDDDEFNDIENDDPIQEFQNELTDVFDVLAEEEIIKRYNKNKTKQVSLRGYTNPAEFERQISEKYNGTFYPSQIQPTEFNQILIYRYLTKFPNDKEAIENNPGLKVKLMMKLLKDNYQEPFKMPVIRVEEFNKFGVDSGNKLIDHMLSLMRNKMSDPQFRKCDDSLPMIDQTICIDGTQKPYLDIRDVKTTIETNNQLNKEHFIIELPGERYPLIFGKTINEYHHGVIKTYQNTSELKPKESAIHNRIIRIIQVNKFIEENSGKSNLFNKLNEMVETKISETNDKIQEFQFKAYEIVDNLLDHAQLFNLVIVNQMINECVNELNSMNAMIRAIQIAHKKRELLNNKMNNHNVFDQMDDEEESYIRNYLNENFHIKDNGVVMTSQGVDTLSFNEFNEIIDEIGDDKIEKLRKSCVGVPYYTKSYGPIQIHVFSKKLSKVGMNRKYHVVITLRQNGKIQISKVHPFTLSQLDVDAKNFNNLMMLSGVWNNLSIDYRLMQIYARHPNQRKSDMLTNLEFAMKHRKRPYTAWKIYKEKLKDMKLGNTSDLLMLRWCMFALLDSCPQTQYTFGIFTAPNRQSPNEMISCYDNVLRETPCEDRLIISLVNEMLQDVKNNFNEYFSKEKIIKNISKLKGVNIQALMSTASSTNYRLPHNFDHTKSQLVKRGLQKQFKFSSMNEAFDGENANVILGKIIDWMHDCSSVCCITSKMNVKSTREIYGFDPVTSAGASAETNIAQVMSDASTSDLIMKEKKKADIISAHIEEAVNRVKTGRSGNVVVFEGDGSKFNQHMILELFAKLYQTINDVINEDNEMFNKKQDGSVEDSIWLTFMKEFYHFYEKKGVVIRLKPYFEAICWMCLCSYHSNSISFYPPLQDESFYNLLSSCSKMFPKNSKIYQSFVAYPTLQFKKRLNYDALTDSEKKFTKQSNDEHTTRLRLSFNKSINQLINQCEHMMNTDWFKPKITEILMTTVDQMKLINEDKLQYINKLNDAEAKAEFNKWVNQNQSIDQLLCHPLKVLSKMDYYSPLPYGMSQGILACSSSVFSSTCLRFTAKKLKQIGLIDWFQCVATSDDMLIVATSSCNCNHETILRMKEEFGHFMSELSIPLNPIKTNVLVNPDFLNFNSTMYRVFASPKSKIQNFHGRKLICMSRMLKNVWLQKVDDPAINYNNVSTNLKLLFSEFNLSRIERIVLINNGRFISNQTQYVNYYFDKYGQIAKERYCSWPSSRETVNELSEYALFSRKEMDLLWMVKNKIIKDAIKNNTSSVMVNRDSIIDNCEVNEITQIGMHKNKLVLIFQDQLIQMCSPEDYEFNNSNPNIPSIKFKYKSKEYVVTLPCDKPTTTIDNIKINLNSPFIRWVEEDEIEQILLNKYGIMNQNYRAIKWTQIANNKCTSAQTIYHEFLMLFGDHLQKTHDPLGFRIICKKVDGGGKMVSMLKGLNRFTVHSTSSIINLVTHFADTYREQIPFNLYLKMLGTPHISIGHGKLNPGFGSFAPITTYLGTNVWRIPLTGLTNNLLKMNPFNEFTYGFIPDNTSGIEEKSIEFELDKYVLETNEQSSHILIGQCLSMLSDNTYKLNSKLSMMTGIVCPHLPGMTFNGMFNLPTENSTLRSYLNKGVYYDPFIMCQTKREKSYTGPGVLCDVFTNRIYILMNDSIVGCYKNPMKKVNELEEIQPSDIIKDELPACIRHYMINHNRTVINSIMNMEFHKHHWYGFGDRQKLAKFRCMPSHTYNVIALTEKLDVETRKLIKYYINRRESSDDKLNDGIWKYKIKSFK